MLNSTEKSRMLFDHLLARRLPAVVLVALGLITPLYAVAAQGDENWLFGVRLRVGWKYDDVRMCEATPRGVPHGPDIDISVFSEVSIVDAASVDINLPVFRPILFGFAAKMLQFEPEVTLLFRGDESSKTQFVAGPSMGVSIHYGPDLNSGAIGAERGPSFWAVGPRIGGYVGLDFTRPSKKFNFQLGLHPYFTPLLSINDPQNHRGWIAGITLDNSFRFHANP